VRVGDYRIIYTIADDVLLIVVLALGHRREVYTGSGLPPT
jgi:mRNA interferase RelE/StbE